MSRALGSVLARKTCELKKHTDWCHQQSHRNSQYTECLLCSVQDLTKEKEELTKERDSHLEQIVHVSVILVLLFRVLVKGVCVYVTQATQCLPLQMRKKVAEANERIRKAESDREAAESTVIAVSSTRTCTHISLMI